MSGLTSPPTHRFSNGTMLLWFGKTFDQCSLLMDRLIDVTFTHRQVKNQAALSRHCCLWTTFDHDNRTMDNTNTLPEDTPVHPCWSMVVYGTVLSATYTHTKNWNQWTRKESLRCVLKNWHWNTLCASYWGWWLIHLSAGEWSEVTLRTCTCKESKTLCSCYKVNHVIMQIGQGILRLLDYGGP